MFIHSYTKEELSTIFRVNADGKLERYYDPQCKIKEGWCEVDNKSGKYTMVRFKGRIVQYHRILWALLKGDIPEGYEVDHIDRNKRNNSIDNLRLVTRSYNMINKESVAERGGLLGSWLKDSNCYRALVMLNGKKTLLGIFTTLEDADKVQRIAMAKAPMILSSSKLKAETLKEAKETHGIFPHRVRKGKTKPRFRWNRWYVTQTFNGNKVDLGTFVYEKDALTVCEAMARAIKIRGEAVSLCVGINLTKKLGTPNKNITIRQSEDTIKLRRTLK